MLRVHTDIFMKVYWYSINSVTTMVFTLRFARLDHEPAPKQLGKIMIAQKLKLVLKRSACTIVVVDKGLEHALDTTII